ncbi:MAG TPA: hypothetical protein VFU02_17770 [Polyangiaceae bacterium]|nr:hypothetical protein [Polyangiaceae bacterium]
MSSRKRKWSLSLLGVSLLVVAAVASAQSAKARYPYDPACAWGRIANGKGMLVRCLSEQEAVALAKGTAPVPVKAAADATEKPASEGANPDAPGDEQTKTGPLTVDVGPITADQGTLSIGRLHVPKDRYAKCVEDNGGLEGKDAEVHVRFLVRGEVSRAEGVSVSKRRNLSPAAAKCVADVVDRRRVGTPDAPMVGATLVIKFSR